MNVSSSSLATAPHPSPPPHHSGYNSDDSVDNKREDVTSLLADSMALWLDGRKGVCLHGDSSLSPHSCRLCVTCAFLICCNDQSILPILFQHDDVLLLKPWFISLQRNPCHHSNDGSFPVALPCRSCLLETRISWSASSIAKERDMSFDDDKCMDCLMSFYAREQLKKTRSMNRLLSEQKKTTSVECCYGLKRLLTSVDILKYMHCIHGRRYSSNCDKCMKKANSRAAAAASNPMSFAIETQLKNKEICTHGKASPQVCAKCRRQCARYIRRHAPELTFDMDGGKKKGRPRSSCSSDIVASISDILKCPHSPDLSLDQCKYCRNVVYARMQTLLNKRLHTTDSNPCMLTLDNLTDAERSSLFHPILFRKKTLNGSEEYDVTS